MSEETCPDCGGATGGWEGCQALFEGQTAQDFSDYRYGREHRLSVDAYALQHPDRYGRSAKSLAAHLTGALVALEHAADAPELNAAIQRWLSTNPQIARPEPPVDRGRYTIADVASATDPEEHVRRVRAWAASAWQAWRAHHALAREWVAAARGRAGVR